MKKMARVTMPMPDWMVAEVEEFRKTYGCRSTGAALRKLVDRALQIVRRRA